MLWKINFHVGKAGVMNSATMVTWPKPQLTDAALSEFIAAGRKTQKSLLAKPVETISQKSFSIRLRRCKALSFAVLPALQPCATCGKHYNSSTAPIEPSKFCSRQCEVDIYASFLKIRA
jgi:hypothetical protein